MMISTNTTVFQIALFRDNKCFQKLDQFRVKTPVIQHRFDNNFGRGYFCLALSKIRTIKSIVIEIVAHINYLSFRHDGTRLIQVIRYFLG